MKIKKPKIGNKYRTYSKASKEGEIKSSGGKYMGTCPTCDCCISAHYDKKINICYNCYFGLANHTKYGKPAPRDQNDGDRAVHV